jgi:hypothetical protein
MSKEIDWGKLTDKEMTTIRKIVKRAAELEKFRKMDAIMDIGAAHLSCHLDLEKFLAFDNFSFFHDFTGIRNCLDRETGELKSFFVPRCAKKEATS